MVHHPGRIGVVIANGRLLDQMARGGSRLSAARYLGIPPGTLQSTTLLVRTWQKQPGNADAYQETLHAVAEIVMKTGSPEPTR
ncbi:hypothetical protein [Streptomyces sp. NPDC101206]|uniref:hypothetical protein n=1 Tax=Streptomyces sp. NPDC101206 TaxID=3366128 RepID=UPI0037F24991